MLLFVSMQYHRMVNDDPGYDYKDVAFADIDLMTDSVHRAAAVEELRRLPEVSVVSYGMRLPKGGYWGGNPINLPGDEDYRFVTADMAYCGEDYLDVYGIRLLEGRKFTPGRQYGEEVLVSRNFVKQMQQTGAWEDGAIGKTICNPGIGDGKEPATVCGVYEDFRIAPLNMSELDRKGSIMYYYHEPAGYLMIRFTHLTPDALKKAEAVLATIAPDKDIHLYSYANEFLTDYKDTRKFRDAVLIGGIVTLAIVFIGLVGYTMDEVNRRSKEMAIRKINGATISDVMRLFLGDVLRMALPAVVIGCLVAYIILREWLQQYAEKVALGWYYFAAGGAAVLLVVLGVAAYNVYGAATANPVGSLKNE